MLTDKTDPIGKSTTLGTTKKGKVATCNLLSLINPHLADEGSSVTYY